MTKEKLVRDEIPHIIARDDPAASFQVRVASQEEIFGLLLDKLDEEVSELKVALLYCSASNKGLDLVVTESADVLEVLRAILDRFGINYQEVETTRKSKAETRGSFSRHLVLTQNTS